MNKTAERRYGILKVLNSSTSYMTRSDLAERFGVSKKTIEKDILKLEDLGYRFDKQKGHHGGIKLKGAPLNVDYILFEQDDSYYKEFARIELSSENQSEDAKRFMVFLKAVLIDRAFE